VIRQNTRELVFKLIQFLSPQLVLNELLSKNCVDLNSRQQQIIREEIINVVIKILLQYPEYQYDYQHLAIQLIELLKESKEKVKFVAVEALTIINLRMPSRLNPLLLKTLDAQTYEMLTAKFQRGKPAFLNEEGAVQFRAVTHGPETTTLSKEQDHLPRRWSALNLNSKELPHNIEDLSAMRLTFYAYIH
jgi:hypothetical protein